MSVVGGNSNMLLLWVAVGIPIVIALLLGILLYCWCRTKRSKRKMDELAVEADQKISAMEHAYSNGSVDAKESSRLAPHKEDLEVDNSNNGTTANAAPSNELSLQRKSSNDRSWRSFAPNEAQANAIVALCGKADELSSSGSSSSGAGAPAKASPKLSAATDVLIKKLNGSADEDEASGPLQLPAPATASPAAALSVSASSRRVIPLPSGVPGVCEDYGVTSAPAPDEPAPMKKSDSAVSTMIQRFNSMNPDHNAPPGTPWGVSSPNAVARTSSLSCELSPGKRDFPADLQKAVLDSALSEAGALALLRAREANETKASAMEWLQVQEEEKKRHDEEEKTPKSDGEADTEAGEASVAPECSNATSRQSSFQASRQISVPVSVPAVLSPKNSFLKSSTDGSSGWSLMPEVAEPTAAQQPADQETTAEMLVTEAPL